MYKLWLYEFGVGGGKWKVWQEYKFRDIAMSAARALVMGNLEGKVKLTDPKGELIFTSTWE